MEREDEAMKNGHGCPVIDAFLGWADRNSILLLRLSLGIVFIWFGGLKIPGMSPAATLVKETVTWMPIPGELFVKILGWWEVLIGLCFLVPRLTMAGFILFAVQMVGTFLPLALLPVSCYTRFPYALTLEGQYIVKNVVLIAAALTITARTYRAGDRTGRRDPAR